jgi:osmoprotectant transport system substrate-binding protein
MRRIVPLILVVALLTSCRTPKLQIVIGSKFFTEQVVLAELLAQHIEARTGIHVERKTNLGGKSIFTSSTLAPRSMRCLTKVRQAVRPPCTSA